MNLRLWGLRNVGSGTEMDNMALPRMRVRSILAAAPILLSGYVGFHARTHSDAFAVPSASQEQDAQVLAYAPLVRDSRIAIEAGDASGIVNVGKQWVDAAKSGHLKPLYPTCFEDGSRIGGKAEVMRARAKLVDALLRASRESRASTSTRFDSAILALRVSESLKYSDFRTVYACGGEQRRALTALKDLIPQMSEAQRQSAKKAATELKENQGTLKSLTSFSRRQYYDWMERQGVEPLSIEDVRRAVRITDQIADAPTDKRTAQLVRSPLSSRNDAEPEYFTEVSVAWGKERMMTKALDAFIFSVVSH